jgi:hypothetical protein
MVKAPHQKKKKEFFSRKSPTRAALASEKNDANANSKSQQTFIRKLVNMKT